MKKPSNPKSKKTTRYVRVTLDFVLEYAEACDSLPSGFAFVNITDFIVGGVKATALAHRPKARVKFGSNRIDAILPGARLGARLDFRPTQTKEDDTRTEEES